MFEPSSRYYAVETARLTLADARVLAYKRRRFVPPGDTLGILVEVAVAEGDRLDLVTARTLGDPQQFWRICDANDALEPATLTAVPGRMLRVPVPQA